MINKKRLIRLSGFIFIALILALNLAGCGGVKNFATDAASGATKSIDPGSTWEISKTTYLSSLNIADGASIKVPEGCSLTMTVDGVETGQKLVDLKAADGATHLIPGSYKGDIVLTVSKANPTKSFKLRQALYLDQTGVVADKSVLAAVAGKKPAGFNLNGITINSTGECFNGIYVAGGKYTFNNLKINFIGDGRSDFEGYGAAIMATGNDTRLVVDNSKVQNKGIVRTGVVAAGGSNVIVKNSIIETHDGEKPPFALSQRGGSGLGGSIGLCRATIVLGTNTRASYINSTVTGSGWGLLATDDSKDIKLAAINSTISHTDDIGGYGAYAIGNATEWFLGSELNVSCTGVTLKDGHIYYGDSTPEAVADLNEKLGLGLTKKELKSIPSKNTVINSKLFGIMATHTGSVDVSGGTIFNTRNTTFMNKGQPIDITVDGSKGVQLNPGNGVIMQLMDDDDPGMSNSTYSEFTTAPKRDEKFDLTSTDDAAISKFSNIIIKGDFYNSFGWGKNAAKSSAAGGLGSGAGGPGSSGGGMPGGAMPGGGSAPGSMDGPGGSGSGMPGGGMSNSEVSGRNMVLAFNNARITGAISSSESHHSKPVLDMLKDYKLFGVVTNTAHEPINNGVIVSLAKNSTWTITGTSYLTSLTMNASSAITAPPGYNVTMTVDGVKKEIKSGTYKGKIVLTINKG
jgi:hypothetical protein